MAANEGIGSPFLKQPSARSPKLHIYESLFLLNQGVDHVLALLHRMEKFAFADKESLQSGQVEIEGVRCGVNADFVEHLADSERFDEGHFWKQKRAFEKKWRDPWTTCISMSSAARRNERSRGCSRQCYRQYSSALSGCPSGRALGSRAGAEEDASQKASEVMVERPWHR